MTFEDDIQSKVMTEVVSHLIEDHDLISRMDSIPYVPGDKNAVISDRSVHTDGRNMRTYRELPSDHYLFTNVSKESKKRYMKQFAENCGLEVEFGGKW